MIVIFVLFGLWSLVFPLGKYVLQFSSPVFVTGARMTLAGLLMFLFLLYRKKIPTFSSKQLFSLCLLALFSIYLTNILEFWSLTHLSAAKTCFLYSLSPFLTALLSYIHFKEKMTPLKWLGLGIGFAGMLPVILEKTETTSLTLTFLPELAMLGAVFFSTYGWVILRLLVKENDISPPVANSISMLLGGVLALITSLFCDTWSPAPIATQGIAPLLLVTFLSNILCYNLYGYLLKRYTATLLSFFGLFSPLFASLHSWLILSEPPSLAIILSVPLLLFGLFLVHREELKQGYLPS